MKSFMVMVLLVSLACKAKAYGQYSSDSESESESESDISTRRTPYVFLSRNLTVFEGRNITFTCTIPGHLDPGNVYWFKDFSNISNCIQGSVPDTSDKVKHISVSSTGRVCTLSIYQVTPMDTSQYYCGLSATVMEDDASSDSGSGRSFLNDDIDEGLTHLTVLSVTLSPPICEVLPTGEHHIGDRVSLTCRPPVNSQLSLLAWYDDKTDTPLSPQQITKPGSTLVVPRVLDVEDSLASFTCIAASVKEGWKANMTSLNCSVIPLRVLLTVGLTPHTVHVLDRAEALFHCVASEKVKSYHWHILRENRIQYVSPTCGSCRYKILEGGKILAIPEVHVEEDDGLQVKCSAANTHREEESSHWGLLTVERPNNSSQGALISQSGVGSIAAWVFTVLNFLIMVGVLAYLIHIKSLLRDRCTSLRRTPSMSGQDASQAIELVHRHVQHDGCRAESAEEVYAEVPNDLQADCEVPKELPVKDKKTRADTGRERIVEVECKTYDVPRPIEKVYINI